MTTKDIFYVLLIKSTVSVPEMAVDISDTLAIIFKAIPLRSVAVAFTIKQDY